MKIFKTQRKLSLYIVGLSKKSKIGFVPTMGSLHDGHLQLIRKAKNQCSIVLCSIFINPTQFNSKADFINYPKTLTKDLKKLKRLNCDLVYVPEVIDLYKKNEKAKRYCFNELENSMEGKFRKGHFNGVATVIEKFICIIKPDKIYFGQKDLQQFLIVKHLCKKLNLCIEIISIPTVRDQNGLAMSSRNNLLNGKQLKQAALLYKSLIFCKENINTNTIKNLKKSITHRFSKEIDVKLEYFEFVNVITLQPVSDFKKNGNIAICIAAYIGPVRLIDNIIL